MKNKLTRTIKNSISTIRDYVSTIRDQVLKLATMLSTIREQLRDQIETK